MHSPFCQQPLTSTAPPAVLLNHSLSISLKKRDLAVKNVVECSERTTTTTTTTSKCKMLSSRSIVSNDNHTLLPLRHIMSLRSFRRYDGDCYGNLAWHVYFPANYTTLIIVRLPFVIPSRKLTAIALRRPTRSSRRPLVHIIANYGKYAATRVIIEKFPLAFRI